jgi:hypothetical protein
MEAKIKVRYNPGTRPIENTWSAATCWLTKLDRIRRLDALTPASA